MLIIDNSSVFLVTLLDPFWQRLIELSNEAFWYRIPYIPNRFPPNFPHAIFCPQSRFFINPQTFSIMLRSGLKFLENFVQMAKCAMTQNGRPGIQFNRKKARIT